MDWQPFYVTLKLAVATTGLLVVLAAPLAYCLAYARFPGRSLIEALVNPPLALPPTVIGFYLVVFMGRSGGAVGGAVTLLGIVVASFPRRPAPKAPSSGSTGA